MDIKISQLPVATSASASDQLVVNQTSGSVTTTRTCTVDQALSASLNNQLLSPPPIGTVTPNIASFTAVTGASFNSITGLSSTNPLMNGTASTGTAVTVARADHIHPSDTSLLPLSGGAMTGSITIPTSKVITITDTPTVGTSAANKNYVDSVATGLSWKQVVNVATTANITLSGTQTIDTVAVVAGNRVLVKNQSTPSQNGIYVVATGSWTRSTDMDQTTPLNEFNGASCLVVSGTQANTSWVETATVNTVGTDAVTFAQFNGASALTAGSGLTITGNTLSVNGSQAFTSATFSSTTDSTSTTTGAVQISGGLGVALNIYAGANVTAYSDVRLKTNITRITNALAKVNQLSGYTFDRTDIVTPRQTGVIAQEVQKVLPEAVVGDEILAVAYGNLVGLLIEAIKELNAKVENLS